jgi:hypothetical protein
MGYSTSAWSRLWSCQICYVYALKVNNSHNRVMRNSEVKATLYLNSNKRRRAWDRSEGNVRLKFCKRFSIKFEYSGNQTICLSERAAQYEWRYPKTSGLALLNEVWPPGGIDYPLRRNKTSTKRDKHTNRCPGMYSATFFFNLALDGSLQLETDKGKWTVEN